MIGWTSRRSRPADRDAVEVERWVLDGPIRPQQTLENSARRLSSEHSWELSRRSDGTYVRQDGTATVPEWRYGPDLEAKLLSAAPEAMRGVTRAHGLRLLAVPSQAVEALWASDGGVTLLTAPSRLTAALGSAKVDETAFMNAVAEAASRTARPQPPTQRHDLRRSTWPWIAITAMMAIVLVLVFRTVQSAHPAVGRAFDLRNLWLIVEADFAVWMAALGWLKEGRPDGIFIDDRNRVSLARVQSVLWFALVFGLYLVIGFWNVSRHWDLPTGDGRIWALLGITSASPAVSGVILSSKAATPAPGQAPHPGPPLDGGSALPPPEPPPGKAASVGLLDRNLSAKEASWEDVYLGEEVANRDTIDVSRLQQVVATVALAITFWTLALQTLAQAQGKLEMPPIGDGFVWLIGLSSGAYMASKAAPKTPVSRS